MRTKVVINMSVVFEHEDNTQLYKKQVAQYLRGLIEGDDGTDSLRPIKVVVRTVDSD